MFPDQFIQVGALRARYWQAGEHGSPLLLIHGIGVAVEWFSENIATLAQQRIPQARLQVWDQCGHNPQVEQKAEFHQQLFHFLQDVEP